MCIYMEGYHEANCSAVFVLFLAVQLCSPEFGFKSLMNIHKCLAGMDPHLSLTWVHLGWTNKA